LRTDTETIEQVRSAYADVHFGPSYEEVVLRAGGRRRRRRFVLPFAAGLAVAAAAAVVLVVQLVRPSPAEQEAAAFDTNFAAQCAGLWSTLAPAYPYGGLNEALPAVLPPTEHTFTFRDGEMGLRVYAADRWMFVCQRAVDGRVHGAIDPFSPPEETNVPVSVVAESNLTGGPEQYVGSFTGEADRVLARLADGRTIAGVVSGGMFVIWSPRERLAGAEVELYQGDHLVWSGPPNHLTGSYDDAVFAKACDRALADSLSATPNIPDAARNGRAPERFTSVRPGEWLRFYGDSAYMAVCDRADGTGRIAVANTFTPTPAGWRPLQRMTSLNSPCYTFGVAPAGTKSVEVALTDGQTLAARLSGGFFLATWEACGSVDLDVARVVAYTPDTVYESKPGHVLETHPR
jgi:hypothetical protein